MKKIMAMFLSAFIILACSGNIISANSITSYYKASNKVTSYREAFKLVQRKNKDNSKSSYYKPLKKHGSKLDISYFKDGKKNNPITYTVKNKKHSQKVMVTNDDSLYQLPANLHGKIQK